MKWLKRIIDIIVYGRSKDWWTQTAAPPKFALDAALSGNQGAVRSIDPDPTALQKLLRWFDGKKTYTGAALVALPAIIGALTGFYEDVGLNTMTFLRVAGIALATVGAIHKLVKILDDLTPDVEGKE